MNSFEMDLIHLTVAAAMLLRLPLSRLLLQLLVILVILLLLVPVVHRLPYTICME